MKKTILYLCFTSLLTIPNAIATEVATRANTMSTDIYPLVELLQKFRAQNESLRDQLETQDIRIAMDTSREEGAREDLEHDLAHMIGEVGKEQASKEALQRLVNIMKEEQRESKQLLHQVLEELIPSFAPLMEESQTLQAALLLSLSKTKEEDIDETETPKEESKPKKSFIINEIGIHEAAERSKEKLNAKVAVMPALSPYQQKLLFQRNLIGDEAWTALNGTNSSLSAKLLEAIQGYPGKSVEVVCLYKKSFKLTVNHKQQNYPYTF